MEILDSAPTLKPNFSFSRQTKLNTASLVAILQKRALHTPDAPYITHLASGRTVSFIEILQTAQKIAGLLASLKVGRKGRVAFVVRNHWLLFPLLIACISRRATLVPIDPELHKDELSNTLSDAAPALTITLNATDAMRVEGKSHLLSLAQLEELVAISDCETELEADLSSDVALMIYTSGTTGSNKCVMLTDGNLVANATSLVKRYSITPQDRFFCTLPTHHMNAIMMTGMVPLVAGAHVVLDDILSFKNAKHFWRNLSEHGVTICSLVPSIMALLLKLFPEGANAPVPALRFGFCGAAPLTSKIWRQFEAIFGFPIYQGYGLTETTCWASSTPPGEAPSWNSVGLPMDCEIRIDQSDMVEIDAYLFKQDIPDGSGQTGDLYETGEKFLSGEVLIKGPLVGPGYFKNSKLTKETTTPDGFFRTGDLGFFDQKGHLHISGRLKEIIIKNGTNVFSAHIDQVLAQHESVATCKTIGLPDELVGERICSVCVLKEGHTTTTHELQTWVQSRLSQHMWPDGILLMGYLPTGAAGKISINVLRKIVSGKLTDEIVASLTSWKFKRAQPCGLDNIRSLVQQALIAGAPIEFLSYWGCGKRDSISEHDRLALDRLGLYLKSAQRVPQAPPKLTLILTDVHAVNNRISEERMGSYFAAIQNYASKFGIEPVLLSSIWKAAGLDATQIHNESMSPLFESQWRQNPLQTQLIEQASKHVEQGRDPESAARFYDLACQREGHAIMERYPTSIFLTYNHPDFDRLSPALPKIYMHSYKEGTSVKPWFRD